MLNSPWWAGTLCAFFFLKSSSAMVFFSDLLNAPLTWSEAAMFITGWERHAGCFADCPSFIGKTININPRNVSVCYKYIRAGRWWGRDGLMFPQAVELKKRSSVGFADIWGTEKPTFSKGRPANHCHKCGIVVRGLWRSPSQRCEGGLRIRKSFSWWITAN